MTINYPELIESADIYQAAQVTPLHIATGLSQRTNNSIYLKREDLQPVFSFKIRGAFNKMRCLDDQQKKHGVITASAGNHAQGVAFSAQKLGIPAIVVMPETTPGIKISGVESFGANVILKGESYSDAADYAKQLCETSQATFIHPYDDPLVIAGQGTIGKEILEQLDRPADFVFVCVGGGGLAAGVASYIKSKHPNTKVIGVQAEDSDAMAQSIAQGKRIKLPEVGIFADGVAVKQVGKHTLALCQQYLDDIILVSTDEICAAIKDAFDDTRSVLEPAGALGIAGAKRYLKAHQIQQKTVVIIASGANMNFDRLRHVSERTEFSERREGILAVTVTEQPGSFKRFCDALGKRNITEFNYRYNQPTEAVIYVGIQIKNSDELITLIKKLNTLGYQTVDLTDNEMAKLHIRHLVGGRAPNSHDESLYRFQFPEKPGALMNFLTQIKPNWNISLFHYRNHGADFGRVLCGLQIPNNEKDLFDDFLLTLGYPYYDETDNPAYRLFLSPSNKNHLTDHD